MINIINEKDCCGCAACIDACPKQCIYFKEKTLGHLFPIVDTSKCINCRLCKKVCPILNSKVIKNIEKQVFATYSKDFEIRKKSSSGGMFYTIAAYLINNGYIVFGAAFNDNLKLKITKATSIKDLDILCKSKYLQSSMIGGYKEIKELLNNNNKVMFCGTPCQVAAIRSYLSKEYKNLILVDFLCHGVPSQKYFDKCKELVENKKNIKILSYEFRTKIKNGVTPHYFKVKYIENNKEKNKIDFYYNSLNYAAFQKYINLRESCYECKFTKDDRYSDITIGDFHSIESYSNSFNRFDGVSTVVINTSKGNDLFDIIKCKLLYQNIDYNELVNNKELFIGPTKKPLNREEFINDYNNVDFKTLNKKWFNKRKYIKQIIYYRLPKHLRKIILKIGG